jgi:hypothetical protein
MPYLKSSDNPNMQAGRPALLWDIKHRMVENHYRRFGQPIFPIFNGQAILDFFTLEDGNDRLSETSVLNYQYRLHNTPEERRFYVLLGGSLKSPVRR